MPAGNDIVIIKKYANRRLYNTETSMYVTLEDLSRMVKENREFEVVDAKTGRDITHQVLTQIIFDEETKGMALLPIRFLRQIIRFYDDSLQSVLPHYLEMTMDVFTKNQERVRENAAQMFGPFNPFAGTPNLEDMQRRNLELLQKSFSLFNPFATVAPQADTKDRKIDELTKEVAKLNAEIDKVRKGGK